MAPITAASAKLAYDKAANQLKRACSSLERHLPPPQDGDDDFPEAPSLVPRVRADSVASGCALCVSELLDLEPGERQGHRCTHQDQINVQPEDNASATGSDSQRQRVRTNRSKQPVLGVVKEYLDKLESCLDRYTDAVSVVCSTFANDNERESYQDHLIAWVEHCEDLKDRAREVITVLEAAQITGGSSQQVSTISTTGLQSTQTLTQAGNGAVSSATVASTSQQAISSSGVVQELISLVQAADGAIPTTPVVAMPVGATGSQSVPYIYRSAPGTEPLVFAGPSSQPALSSYGSRAQATNSSAPIMSTGADRLAAVSQAQCPPRSWTTSSETLLELAF